MGDQTKKVVDYFNSLEETALLTSTDLYETFSNGEVSKPVCAKFLSMAYMIGAAERDTSNGKPYTYMKVRSLTKKEETGLTVWPGCIDFQKEVRKKFKIKQEAERLLQERRDAPEIIDEGQKDVAVKSYSRKSPRKRSKRSVKITVEL